MNHQTVLIVEDEKLTRWSLKERLERDGYEVLEAGTGREGLELVDRRGPDLLLLDQRLPDTSGLDVLRRVAARHADVPVILMTAYGAVETAVEAMKMGAADYVDKPFTQDEMAARVKQVLAAGRKPPEPRCWREETARPCTSDILGRSEAIARARLLVEKAGRSEAKAILLTGESGTGRGLAARVAHACSARVSRPLISLSCTALPSELLESELRGAIALADSGTLFLEEIGAVPPALHSLLLAQLAEGGRGARLIASTSRDLASEAQQGRFRQELLERLGLITIHMPALRSRPEDIPILVEEFVRQFNRDLGRSTSGLTEEAMKRLVAFPWPGNVRQLRDVIQRAMILDDRSRLDVEDLPEELQGAHAAADDHGPFRLPDDGYPLENLEREMVSQALERTHGNQTRSARLLHISRDAMRYKMKKFGLL